MPLELWGGHECTVNRVGDRFFDQTVRSGHQDRIEDLARFAEIGFKALRYPVLWERVSPERPDVRDWRWTDERLAEIRRLGMRPIAGLIHHGSGPRYTHLLDDGFATGLAAHALAAAERYPWIEAWTPVNEPLTTARFSALYGHWYPHARDEGAFFAALLNQIDGVRLSMRAIRSVNPEARLIQTEDLGHTFATPPLAHQAAHDNNRRWLAWDLLTGKVDPDHAFWEPIARHGLAERLHAILEDPCPPDVVGVNYYLSSERFLDHRAERYPLVRRGGNGEDAYADVEAVRAVAPSPMGLERLLEATWRRYGLPMAVTECHNGCTREEQMRWINETWSTAQRLRGRGVPIEAVTAWSLLGAYDWNRLLTADLGHYEVGVYDLRNGEPRPTGAVELCRRLAHGEPADQPVLQAPGWWSRDIRFEFEPVWCPHPDPVRRRWSPSSAHPQPVLITGATGTLGRALARGCEHRGIPYVLTCRNELAIDSAASIDQALDQFRPWAVINAAGWVRVDEAEADEPACHAANAEGAALLARACADRGLRFATFSSDLVFDGSKPGAYLEDDAPSPLSAYGRSKAAGEAAVLAAGGAPLVVRTAAFFSPFDPHNFAQAVVRSLTARQPFHAANDVVVSPTYTPDLVNAVLDLLVDGEAGVWHLSSGGALSWADFARRIGRASGLDEGLVVPLPVSVLGWAAPRPRAAALASRRGKMMPDLDDAISRFAGVVAGMSVPALSRMPALRRETAADARVSFAPVAEI
ncbi:MAG TPA: family 1 glycosylhydrolase [Caulobacteraceae bacterium]|jgi:dTDP-4-dehydrorhamnose reductase|nr:family 1 glycosylhydrolase [Caulobacteraceae bacterium]